MCYRMKSVIPIPHTFQLRCYRTTSFGCSLNWTVAGSHTSHLKYGKLRLSEIFVRSTKSIDEYSSTTFFSSTGKIIIMLLMPSSLRIYLYRKKMVVFSCKLKKKFYVVFWRHSLGWPRSPWSIFYSPFSRIYFIVSLWSAPFYSVVLFFFYFALLQPMRFSNLCDHFYFYLFVFVCVHLYRERLRAQRIKLGNGYVSIQWASY